MIRSKVKNSSMLLLQVTLPTPTPAFGLHFPLCSPGLLPWHLRWLQYVLLLPPLSPYHVRPMLYRCSLQRAHAAVAHSKEKASLILHLFHHYHRPCCPRGMATQGSFSHVMRPNPSRLSAKSVILFINRQ